MTLAKPFAGMALLAMTACSSSNFAVPQSGQGVDAKAAGANQVDVLWVIDSSGNMSASQKLLAKQAPDLITAFNQIGVDYQMAVTTMDVTSNGEQGRFLSSGGAALLTSNTVNLLSTLGARLYVGDYDWHPPTQAVDALRLALTAPNSNGVNAGFLRTGAFLAVIFVTASNDKSSSFDAKTWLDTLRPKNAVNPRTWAAEFIGALPADVASGGACTGDAWTGAVAGQAYIDLANYSGGVSTSICGGDFLSAIAKVKTNILETMTAYPIDQVPAKDSISVLINGVSVPNDAVNGWTFDPNTLTIRFHGSALPAAGSKVVVSFQPGSL